MEKRLLNQYTTIIEKANIVSKTDVRWIIIHVNDKFCEVSWYSREELIWKPHNYIRHPDMPKELFKDLWNTIKVKKQIWQWIIKNKKKDWSPYWVQSFISPILDDKWNIIEFVSVRTDITDLYITKDKLEQSIFKLQELDQKKSDFLNIASHELRTPMTIIKWYISMLIDWDIWKVDKEARLYLEKIFNNVKWLLNLINDMLDISKIEAWKIWFFYEYFNLNEFIDNLLPSLKTLALEKKVEIVVNINYNNLIIYSDKSKLSQLLNNIISNAIKFTPNNWKIEFNSYLDEDKIYFNIKDNWIWISKKDLSKIFEKFWQVRNSLTRDIWWTWLWLPIVLWILKEMWWELTVKSRLNKWSEFMFYLPL